MKAFFMILVMAFGAATVAGPTAGTVFACIDPSCGRSVEQTGFCTGLDNQMASVAFCDEPGCE